MWWSGCNRSSMVIFHFLLILELKSSLAVGCFLHMLILAKMLQSVQTIAGRRAKYQTVVRTGSVAAEQNWANTFDVRLNICQISHSIFQQCSQLPFSGTEMIQFPGIILLSLQPCLHCRTRQLCGEQTVLSLFSFTLL